ncbi:MAG: DUF1287 domain-containing protein [Legionellales bacterium]|nr:DUF1287 domain-containing protein [Legionellales bacterium]
MKNLILIISILLSTIITGQTFSDELSDAGILISKDYVVYDGSYRRIDYPNGDVPPHIGVCTDVIIRAYRKVGIDLQKELHEDIVKNLSKYRRVDKPDPNIDHRRVPNLATFFKRHGKVLPITDNPDDYKPGDIIWWNLANNGSLNHIGMVVDKKSYDNKRYLVVHNIGGGQNIDDFLFGAKIIGHYSYNKK